MHLIYSKGGRVVEGLSGQYRNGDYFRACEACTAVSVAEEYEHIAEAYKAQGIEASVIGDSSHEDDKPPVDLDKLKVDELKALLDERGIEYLHDAKKADLVALAVAHEPNA